MGRRDAVQFTLELVAEWRRLGAEVTFEPGWERRGNGYGADYEGAVIHHTASVSSEARTFPTQNVLRDGRPGLTGPLCNSAGPWCPPDRPRIHVMAAFPANHAGASGGRSMGPLPRTSLFNPKVWGHEIDYAGTVAMAPGQWLAALIVAKGVANVLRRSIEYVRAHFETSVTGKFDIGYAPGKSYDMAAFRRDAANYEGDTLSAVEVQQIITHIEAGVVVRLEQLLQRTAPFKLLKLAGSNRHVACGPNTWVELPASNPAGYASLLQARLMAAAVTEVPENEWNYFYLICTAPQAGDVDTGALVERIVAAIPEAHVEGALAAARADLAAQANAIAEAVNDEADRRARDGEPATGPVS